MPTSLASGAGRARDETMETRLKEGPFRHRIPRRWSNKSREGEQLRWRESRCDWGTMGGKISMRIPGARARQRSDIPRKIKGSPLEIGTRLREELGGEERGHRGLNSKKKSNSEDR